MVSLPGSRELLGVAGARVTCYLSSKSSCTSDHDSLIAYGQVAKALLDSAAKKPPQPQAPSMDTQSVTDPALLAALLRFRVDSLTAEVAMAIGRAAKSAAPRGKKAAAAAANDAYEDNLDTVLQLGWAHVDRITFEVRPQPLFLVPEKDHASCL